MSDLTPDEVRVAVHPIDDVTVAEIIATGVNHDELVQACHFFAKEQKSDIRHDVPPGRIGRVVSILERVEVEVRESWLGEYGSHLE
jgi:hypothetical protein